MSHIYTDDEQRAWQKQLPKKNTSAHVLVCHQKEILIVKPLYKLHWVFPGGVIDENESPQQAAVRELREETGITVPVSMDNFSFAGVSYLPTHAGFPERIAFSFLYNCTSKPKLTLQESEIESADWVNIEDILEKIDKKRAFYSDLNQKIIENIFPFYSDLTIIP